MRRRRSKGERAYLDIVGSLFGVVVEFEAEEVATDDDGDDGDGGSAPEDHHKLGRLKLEMVARENQGGD